MAVEDLIRGLTFREITYIPTTHPPFVASTAFVATLAYPQSHEDRDRFIRVATAYMARYMRTVHGADQIRSLMRPRDIDRAWKRAMKKLNERMLADRVARALLLARVGMETGSLHVSGIENLRHAIGYVRLKMGHELPEGWHDDYLMTDHGFNNFVSRIWSPSKPVLHLAWAVWQALEEGKHPRLDNLLYEPEWVLKALQRLPSCARNLIERRIVTSDEQIMLIPEP